MAGQAQAKDKQDDDAPPAGARDDDAPPAGDDDPPPRDDPSPRPSRGRRSASDEAVASRASRMAKREVGDLVRAVANGLGIDGVENKEDLVSHLSGLQRERERSMSDVDRLGSRNRELEDALRKATGDKDKWKSAYNKSERDRKTAVGRYEEQEIVFEVQSAARNAGFIDPDYAVALFKRHHAEQGAFKGDPKGFFESKKSDPKLKHLYSEEEVPAGASSLEDGEERRAASTEDDDAPPAAEERGGDDRPSPGDRGAPPPAAGSGGDDDVRELNQKDFTARTADKYGFRPPR